MKPTTDIVEELRLYNRWRRGDEAITAPDPTALGKLLDDAADRIEHLFASGIHTCHADCQRPMCVLRRERDKAHADLARVTAERDEAKSEAESALDTCARTLDERDALRARVADYEERLSAVMPSDFKDWNQNARSEWPEVAARVMQSLVEREHFANGTAELAMHHRDIAEQRVAELEAALEELYETANRFPTFDGSRLASALDSASAALARNRAAQEASK